MGDVAAVSPLFTIWQASSVGRVLGHRAPSPNPSWGFLARHVQGGLRQDALPCPVSSWAECRFERSLEEILAMTLVPHQIDAGTVQEPDPTKAPPAA